MGATDGVDREADLADGALSPHRIEPATVLVDIKAWPGNVSVFGKVGVVAQATIVLGLSVTTIGPDIDRFSGRALCFAAFSCRRLCRANFALVFRRVRQGARCDRNDEPVEQYTD